MSVPPGYSVAAVNFKRDNVLACVVGYKYSKCTPQSEQPRYSCTCLSNLSFTLTIPAENMTIYEQKSKWICDYVQIVNSSYRSRNTTLNIASK